MFVSYFILSTENFKDNILVFFFWVMLLNIVLSFDSLAMYPSVH
uniref:Uncharacterized protein n=1 Tax=Rhizophora mucronata TaxID=61149 RepID=A0A2P2PZ05_RHIMU